MGRPATMRDVAKRARVSQRTVSNVVNNYVHVSPDTRQRVLDAIEELGYRPNVAAQSLRAGRTKIIALAVPNISWPYFGEIAHLVQAEAERRGFTLVVAETEGALEKELQVLKGFNANLIDGLILSSIELGEEDIRQLGAPIPLVLIGERISGAGRPHFQIDGYRAGRELTRHVYDQGARTFLFVGSTTTTMTEGPGQERLGGFLAGLAALGVTSDAWTSIDCQWTYKGGFRALRSWLGQHRPPDAILCMNDIVASGVMRALADAGYRVPDDVLVAGWDDTREAKYLIPSLTTIAPDKEEIARLAVESLAEMLQSGRHQGSDNLVSHRLRVRESTVRDAGRN